MDEIGYHFALQHLHPLSDEAGVPRLPGEIEEALLTQTSRLFTTSSELRSSKRECEDQWTALRQRRKVVDDTRLRLESNSEKYKFFVMEKSQKVKEGLRVAKEQKKIVDSIEATVKEEQSKLQNMHKLKAVLERSLADRECFKGFLEQVIKAQPSPRYRDINELMMRCETLVETRDQWEREHERLQAVIEEQTRCMAQMREEHNEKLLNLYAKQSGLQEQLHDIQGQSQALQRQLKEQEQEELDLKVRLHSMQMSILSLWRMAKANQVILPEDSKKHGAEPPSELKPPQDVTAQLNVVKAYFEDLVVIVQLAKKATETRHYLSPLVSNNKSKENSRTQSDS